MTRRYDEVFRLSLPYFISAAAQGLSGKKMARSGMRRSVKPSSRRILHRSCVAPPRLPRRDVNLLRIATSFLAVREHLRPSGPSYRRDSAAHLLLAAADTALRHNCVICDSFHDQRCRPSQTAIVMSPQHHRAQERPRKPQNQPGHKRFHGAVLETRTRSFVEGRAVARALGGA